MHTPIQIYNEHSLIHFDMKRQENQLSGHPCIKPIHVIIQVAQNSSQVDIGENVPK